MNHALKRAEGNSERATGDTFKKEIRLYKPVSTFMKPITGNFSGSCFDSSEKSLKN